MHPRHRLSPLALATTISLLLALFSVTPLAAQRDALPGVDDDTYESPNFGYTLEWDDRDWQVIDATADDRDGDLLILTNDVSTLYISGITEYDGDELTCAIAVGEIVASPDAFDLYPSESGDRDLDPEDYSYLVDCRELVADEAVVVIVHVFPADELGEQVIEVEAVTQTLDLPAAAGGSGADDLAAAGVDGNTYESPEFGYTLEWDPDRWTVTDAVANRNTTILNLVNEESSLIISGLPRLGVDPDACLANAVDFFSSLDYIDDWRPFDDEDGEPIAGGTRRRAYAAFAYLSTDDDRDYVNYLECRILADATLLVWHIAAERDYLDQAEHRSDVLATLEFP